MDPIANQTTLATRPRPAVRFEDLFPASPVRNAQPARAPKDEDNATRFAHTAGWLG